MNGERYSMLWQWQDKARKNDLACTKCGRIGICTVDHIIPLFFIDNIGLKKESANHDWNFQYLCRACNSLKRANFDMTDHKTFVNLKRYIDLMEEVYKPTKPTN